MRSSARLRNHSIETTFIPASLRVSASSGRAGLTAIPWSVTRISTLEPGVTQVVTSSTSVGMRPRTSGATIIDSAAATAVSQWPPEAPRSTPSEPVSTLTLKRVSTSSALSTTTSSRSTDAPFEPQLAYWLALISMWFGLCASDSAAMRSKLCTSSNFLINPFSCRSTIVEVMPPSA
ncbi:hypothetical protein D3C75_1003590 [compost metagenome]